MVDIVVVVAVVGRAKAAFLRKYRGLFFPLHSSDNNSALALATGLGRGELVESSSDGGL